MSVRHTCMMTATIVGMSVGSESEIPDARVMITCIAVSSIIGRLFMIPIASSETSIRAPSAIRGKAETSPSRMERIICVADETIIGRLSTIAFPMDVTSEIIRSRITGTYSIMTSIAFGRMSPITLPI